MYNNYTILPLAMHLSIYNCAIIFSEISYNTFS